MLATLAFLGCVDAGRLPLQEPESPRLTIETRALADDSPIGNCEVFVLAHGEWTDSEQERMFSGRPDLHTLLESRGARHTSGADGILQVPLPAGFFMIGARSRDGRVAYDGSVDPTYVTRIVLWLAEDRPIRVRCRDAGGKPLAGIPIAVVPEIPIPLSLQTAWTNDEGVAVLSGLGLAATVFPDEFPIGVQLAVDLPLKQDILIPFGDERLLQDPVELTIPPLASVRVVLPGPWRTPDGDAPWMWLAAGTERRGAWCRLKEGATEAVFTHVGLGLTLRAQSGEFGEDAESSPSFAGPTKAGEVVVFALERPAAPSSERRLLALGPDGAPLAQESFVMLREVQAPHHSYMESHRLRSDEEGRVALPTFEKDADEEHQVLHVVRAEHGGAPRLQAEARPAELFEAGAGGVAELRFLECRVLAAGRVVDERGRPLSGVELWLYSPNFRDRQEGRVHVEASRSAADGRFSFLGIDERTPLAISVERPGYERQEVLGIANGTMDVEIVFREAERISGQVLFDTAIAPTDFFVIFESSSGNYHEIVDTRGRFQVQRNGPGTFTSLRVESHEGVEPFLRWTGEELRQALAHAAGGELILDLRGKVRAIPYRFQFAEPQTETNWVGASRIGWNGPDHALLSDESGRLYVAKLPVDLRFFAQGFRSVEILGVSEPVAIQFAPGPRLSLRLDHPEWIPEGWKVRVWVKDVSVDRTVTRELGPSGAVTIPLSDPGSIAYSVWMERSRARHHLSEKREMVVQEGSNEVVIALDRERLRDLTDE